MHPTFKVRKYIEPPPPKNILFIDLHVLQHIKKCENYPSLKASFITSLENLSPKGNAHITMKQM